MQYIYQMETKTNNTKLTIKQAIFQTNLEASIVQMIKGPQRTPYLLLRNTPFLPSLTEITASKLISFAYELDSKSLDVQRPTSIHKLGKHALEDLHL